MFYGWWDWRFVFLLAGSTVVNHVLAVAIHRATAVAARKTLLALALAFDLGLLAYFKYANFFLSSADNLFGTSWIAHVVLPVGISFFTFMAISYVVDTYRGELEPTSLARFAVFQAFFPHLVAGPIVRASELLPQLERPRDPRRVDISRAFVLIVSRPLPEGGDREPPRDPHRRRRLRGAEPAFVARGAGRRLRLRRADLRRLLRVHEHRDRRRAPARLPVPAELHSPYTAVSLQDFWRRWHMTLSRWLRDYLYIPLGGSRKGRC